MSLNRYIHHHEPPRPGKPLVFAFHGTGADESQFPGLIRQILPDAGIVAPRGDVSEHGANRYFRRLAEGVYDMEDLALRTKAMSEFIAAHRARHPDSPAFGLGYSNGANILASVLFSTRGLFDKVILMHPLIPWTPEPLPVLDGTSVLVTAGRRDPICPWPMTEALVALLRQSGAETSLASHGGGHEVRDEEIAAMAVFLNPPSLGK